MHKKEESKYAMPLRELANAHGLRLSSLYAPVPAAAVRELFLSRKFTYDFRSVAFINLKGGVGKTVSAAKRHPCGSIRL